MLSLTHDLDSYSDSTSSSSSSSVDEDELNVRVLPHWEIYRDLFENRGFHLDTVGDVKRFYESYWAETSSDRYKYSVGYSRACGQRDDTALCKDPGLVCRTYRRSPFFCTEHHLCSMTTSFGAVGLRTAHGLS